MLCSGVGLKLTDTRGVNLLKLRLPLKFVLAAPNGTPAPPKKGDPPPR